MFHEKSKKVAIFVIFVVIVLIIVWLVVGITSKKVIKENVLVESEVQNEVKDEANDEVKNEGIGEVIGKVKDETNNEKYDYSINWGDTISFGTYEQDEDNTNGKEEIEWQVLDEQEGRVLVISKYALDCQPYNMVREDITWEDCTLRSWLNQDFIDTAFTVEEQERIPTVTVSADQESIYDDNPGETIAGNDTKDKIFLLSVSEINRYFPTDEEMICSATDYALSNQVYEADNEACIWWLRSPGRYQDDASYVWYEGGIGGHSYDVTGGGVYDGCGIAVRPAMWINLE